jgi:hypothetical protein
MTCSKRRAGTAAHAPSSRGTQEPPLSRRQTSRAGAADTVGMSRGRSEVGESSAVESKSCGKRIGPMQCVNHASGEVGTWSHGLVALIPVEWLQETP